jgi:glycosyltransferase involved in cell wall biosynthesis
MDKLLSVIVLTKNEEQHLPRLLESFGELNADFYIVDSYSSDRTEAIAEAAGARFIKHEFVNYAAQFQWALDNCHITSPWIMRMDADEYITKELAAEIKKTLPNLDDEIGGIILKRRMYFLRKWIRYGGTYPTKLLRIWRHGAGIIEKKWMDEHIILSEGKTIEFKHDIADDNLNTLSWWTDKHNTYATREAIDLLNKEYGFFQAKEIPSNASAAQQDRRKRWYKDNIYSRLPLFIRPVMYFLYRYIIRLGFLDGRRGLLWHFFQGLWYRFLVDDKIFQIKSIARKENRSLREVIEAMFNFKIVF